VGGGHYLDYEIQPGYFCEVNGLDHWESNVVKRMCRHQDKGGREDLEKAIHEIQLILEVKYPEKRQKNDNISSEDVSTSEISSIIEVL
jgi:hypothetical protein